MIRMNLNPFIAVLVITVWSFSQASEAQKAVDLVKKAAQFMSLYGKDGCMEELRKNNGRFCKGELYVFAYDTTGIMVAHPKNHRLIGVNLTDVPDMDGKLYRKEILTLAKDKGCGWVDYKFKNTEKSEIEFKAAYIEKSGGLVLCCGINK
ncbi:MAG TPA: cache domain-containing protein [Chitinispirillaceae bacterium]|nr:cache domain-containing protein [Chitinispirillaceae bacterium]